MAFNQEKVQQVVYSPSGEVLFIGPDSMDPDVSAATYGLISRRKQGLAYLPPSVISNMDSRLFYEDKKTEEDEPYRQRMLDPRTEYMIDMQKEGRGLSGSSGATSGGDTSGCGAYIFSEIIEQNMNYITNSKRSGDANKVVHSSTYKYNGNASAKFYHTSGTTGSNLSIPANALTGDTGGKGMTGNVRIQFWMRYDSIPSADETIVVKSIGTGAAAVGDSFKFHFDQSGTAIKFDFSDYTDSGSGYQHSTTIASGTMGAGGITVGDWHHVAMIYEHCTDGTPISTSQCSVYWNGSRTGQVTLGVTGSLGAVTGATGAGGSGADANISIGGESGGHNPYTGYVDNLHILASPTGTAWYGGVTGSSYTHTASNAGGATSDSGVTVETDTVALMDMDGISGCAAFSMRSRHYAYALCSGWRHNDYILLIREFGVSGDAEGFKFYRDGGTGGPGYPIGGITTAQQGYVVGRNLSNAHHLIAATAGILSLDDKKKIKKTSLDNAAVRVMGSTLEGSTADPGSSNDFLLLFGITEGSPAYAGSSFGVSGGSGGITTSPGYSDWYTFVPTDANVQELSHYVEVINSGTTGSTQGYIIPDAYNYPHTFATGDVLNLYDDVMGFRRATNNDLLNTKYTINNATTFAEISESNLNSSIPFSQGMASGK